MKFLVFLCLLVVAAADEEKTQDKKTQTPETTQNASSLTSQPNLLNNQVFPPTAFSNVFGTTDPVSNLAYTGFNSNVPIQPVNPDFFVNPTSGIVNPGVPTFPVTRAVLPSPPSVVNAGQPTFPVTGAQTTFSVPAPQTSFPVNSNYFPAVSTVPAVNTIPAQFTGVGTGLYNAVPTGVIDPNTANAAPATYRFLTPEAITGLPAQGLQAAQQVGLAAIPAFTSGVLPGLTNGLLQGQGLQGGLLQGQGLQGGLQQILKNPTVSPVGIPNNQGITTGNLPTGPITFRQA